MTKQHINIGDSVNDKRGDPLRTAFGKVNDNFTELYALTGGASAALTELAQDYAAPLFTHADNVGISFSYNDTANKLIATVANQLPAQANNSGKYLTTNGTTASWATVAGGGSSVTTSATAPTSPTPGDLWYDTLSGRTYVYYDSTWVDSSPIDGNTDLGDWAFRNDTMYSLAGGEINNSDTTHGATASLTIPTNGDDNPIVLINTYGNVTLVSGASPAALKTWSFGTEGKLTLPAGTTYEYLAAPLTGHGDGLARLDFGLVTDGVSAQWIAASASPAGSGYSPGDTFTFNAAFLGIPGASVTIEVLTVGAGGSVEDLAFTQPPLYPADIYRDSPINLQVGPESNRWTFGATGTLTLPGDLNVGNNSIREDGLFSQQFSIAAGAGKHVEISSDDGGKVWSFETDGTLTLPAQGSLTDVDQITSAIINRTGASTDTAAIQEAWGNWYGAEITYRTIVDQEHQINGGYTWPWYDKPSWEGYPLLMDYFSSEPGGPTPPPGTLPPSSALAPAGASAINAYLTYQELVSNIDIVSGNKAFSFENTGELSLPGTLVFKDAANAKIVLKGTDSYGYVIEDGAFDKVWTFNANGSLTFPDATVQTSAWTGSVSSLVNGSKTVSLDSSLGNLTFTNGEQIRTNFLEGGIELYQSSDNTIGIYSNGAEIKTFATGGAKHTWTFGTNGQLTVPGQIRKDGGLYMNSGGDGISSTVFVNGTAGSVILRTDNGISSKSLTFDVEGVLTFPDNLKIAGNKIRNVSVVDDLSSGSEIEVTLAKTVITNGVTNSLDGGGGPSLTSRSIVDVGDSKVVMAFQVVNSLSGSPTLTAQKQIEVSSNNVLIGQKTINTDGASTLTAFSGWTFDDANSALTLPSHGIVGGAASTSGLTREIYSGYPYFSTGTFDVTTTWFNDGRIPTNTSVVNPATFFWDGLYDAGNPQSGPPPNTSWKLTGYFIPPITGIYEVIAACNDHGWVSINGVNSAAHNTAVTTTLTKNIPYLLTVYFTNTNTNGTLNLQWKNNSTQISYTGDFTGLLFTDVDVEITASNEATWTFGADGALALPLGAGISETASSSGLLKKKYSGTFVLDPTWFAANAGNLIETSTVSTIQSTDLEVFDAFSFEFTGYFVPPTSANYTFKAHADETFVFWIGAKALSGYTYANKDMYGDFNGTFSEQQTQSFTIALTAGQFYPIRIQWGNSAGWGVLDVFTWANDVGQADTANFSGHIYTANTGTAVVSVSDNKSIVLRTDNATDNNWTFAPNGALSLPAGGDVINSTGVSQLAKRAEGSWTVTTGTNTYSFTVPMDGTYTMWVKGNIPNGIITWNATLSITNSNVPAIGQQYAWNYTGGGSPISLTAIPDQIRGVAGTISTDATYAGTTSNRFDFGISNTSGSSQTIYYGYTKV
jgi:hypothetical protein